MKFVPNCTTVLFAATVFCCLVLDMASARPPVLSDFSVGIEGWTSVPESQNVWLVAGGNPGGYIRFVDTQAGRSKICSPTEFVGDLSAPGLQMSYDYRIFMTGAISAVLPNEIELRNKDGVRSTWTQPVTDVSADWQSVVAPFDEDQWTQVGNWKLFLSDIVEICIFTEFIDNSGGATEDESGFDNIGIGFPELDSDFDGVGDSSDNCIELANANQFDSDEDGYGNRCDADINNDCIVNAVDLGILRNRFFSADEVADFNNDGIVNFSDLGIMRLLFFSPPGPSSVGECVGV